MNLTGLDRWSMKTSLVLTILAMGGLAVILVMVTGSVYRDLALESQRKSLANIVALETAEQLENSVSKATRFSLTLQASKNFRQAFEGNQPALLEDELKQQFHRHYVVTGELDIEQLIVYDQQFQVSASVVADSSQLDKDVLPCTSLVAEARSHVASQRVKPVSGLCLLNGKLYESILVPIAGVRLKGYMQTVLDPLLNIKNVESHFGMPLMIEYPNHVVAYRSAGWPESVDPDMTTIVEHVLQGPAGENYLLLSLAFDVEDLHQKLDKTKLFIFLAAGFITLLAIFMALYLLQISALSPLARLTRQLDLLRQDKEHLGKQITVSGNKELRELATGFNAFTGELHDVYQKLEKLAFTDSLTGLPNRELFYDRLNQLILLCRRMPAPFSLFVMDLDRFKFINDTLGHHVGDQLLCKVGERLHEVVRETDTIARLGGDEFAALLPKVVDTKGAIIVAERVHAALTEPFLIEGHNLRASVSIGIVMHPYHGDNQHELIQRADVAMYHAKHHHLGYAFYEADIDKHNVLELTLESELKHAIQNNSLKLFYQPKIVLETGEVYGVEALARWIHPERGFIPPDSFIPMAEQTGLIHPLTQWVLTTAAQQAKQWHEQGLMLNVAINLSPQSLRDPSLVDTIEAALIEADLAPHFLTLELTETAVMSDPRSALEILSELDEKGVMLSIDDFGTGYSSLAYLKKLPMDEIKIDRSFVMEMDKDKNDAVIVHSTIDLAHNMGLKVIAEGIETDQSWHALKALGCDMGQGYFMCKPVDADSFVEWLKDSSWTAPK